MTNEHVELARLIMGRTTTAAVNEILAAGYRKVGQLCAACGQPKESEQDQDAGETNVDKAYTRQELLELCDAAFVPQEHWSNPDSASAQRQLGEAYALLKAGCEFWIGSDTDERTVWVVITFEGFAHKDYDGGLDTEHFYLPTRERLTDTTGTDWY